MGSRLRIRWQVQLGFASAVDIVDGGVIVHRDDDVLTFDLGDGRALDREPSGAPQGSPATSDVKVERDIVRRVGRPPWETTVAGAAHATRWRAYVLVTTERDLVVLDAKTGEQASTLHGDPPEYDPVPVAAADDVVVVYLPEGTLTCLATDGDGLRLDQLAKHPSDTARRLAAAVMAPDDPLRAAAANVPYHRDQEVAEGIATWMATVLVPDVLGTGPIDLAPFGPALEDDYVTALLARWPMGEPFRRNDAVWPLWYALTAVIEGPEHLALGLLRDRAGQAFADEIPVGAAHRHLRAFAYLHIADNLCSSMPKALGATYDDTEDLIHRQLGIGRWNDLLLAVADAFGQGAHRVTDPVAAVHDHVRGLVPDDLDEVLAFLANRADAAVVERYVAGLGEPVRAAVERVEAVLPALVVGYLAAGIVCRYVAAHPGRGDAAMLSFRTTGREALAEMLAAF